MLSETVPVFEGEDVRMTLPVDSKPPPHLYEWRKDNVDVTFNVTRTPPMISRVHRSDAGDYIIRVRNQMNLTEGDPREGVGTQIVKLRVLCELNFAEILFDPLIKVILARQYVKCKQHLSERRTLGMFVLHKPQR